MDGYCQTCPDTPKLNPKRKEPADYLIILCVLEMAENGNFRHFKSMKIVGDCFCSVVLFPPNEVTKHLSVNNFPEESVDYFDRLCLDFSWEEKKSALLVVVR